MKIESHQYITDKKGNKLSVVLPFKEYKKLLEEIEEAQDIKLYDAVKLRNEPNISFDEYVKQRRKK